MAQKKKVRFEAPPLTTSTCLTCGQPFRPVTDGHTRPGECRLCSDMFIAHQDVYLWVLSVVRYNLGRG
jgi:hypothetical protein